MKSGWDARSPCFDHRMWLGLLYDMCDDLPAGVNEERAMVILYAWGSSPDPHPVSIACPLSRAADSARALRSGGRAGVPRCDACGTAFDLPLD